MERSLNLLGDGEGQIWIGSHLVDHCFLSLRPLRLTLMPGLSGKEFMQKCIEHCVFLRPTYIVTGSHITSLCLLQYSARCGVGALTRAGGSQLSSARLKEAFKIGLMQALVGQVMAMISCYFKI